MQTNPDEPLGEILTLHEAAARLKLTPNAMARAAGDAGRGSKFGRDWRFTEADLAAILQARQVRQRTPLGRPVSASRGEEDAFAEARKLVERRKAERKAARGG
ncbi:hypothetical protein [Chenggangzhangella methanolivorans]|uniref:Helix-turn-helix domain-containing protein n=1 Tax=Chenggangzhangella methanolivorans TaxID=1437009 RepID=A0A9E6UNZ1_9HYPH|nr:hypothetical protein [Chenggangzhangella methanolivorans]QZO01651.1 hypothetical protein K6K41_09775 [Chenggangzhangella methanolivorans]